MGNEARENRPFAEYFRMIALSRRSWNDDCPRHSARTRGQSGLLSKRRNKMSYQAEQGERRRVVVETPVSRREEIHDETVRYPERSGVSGTAIAAIVVGVIALAAIVMLFVMNQNQQELANANTAQPPTTIVQQPAQQPPIVVQQPAPATQPAPVIVNNPPASGGTTINTGGSTANTSNDPAIQTAIDKKLSDDPTLSQLGVIATVMEGKVTLTGIVNNQAQKTQVERAVRSVKGVKSVDNQVTIG
jgi:BON domain